MYYIGISDGLSTLGDLNNELVSIRKKINKIYKSLKKNSQNNKNRGRFQV